MPQSRSYYYVVLTITDASCWLLNRRWGKNGKCLTGWERASNRIDLPRPGRKSSRGGDSEISRSRSLSGAETRVLLKMRWVMPSRSESTAAIRYLTSAKPGGHFYIPYMLGRNWGINKTAGASCWCQLVGSFESQDAPTILPVVHSTANWDRLQQQGAG